MQLGRTAQSFNEHGSSDERRPRDLGEVVRGELLGQNLISRRTASQTQII